ncbi:MAG: sensor histidine kinase [Lachnospiraceae bacterium]|nr:sensor histidine kinase [Lachnospiraceae bacterium]
MTVLIIVTFDFILLKLFVVDINEIMEDNKHAGRIVMTVDKERDSLRQYLTSNTSENEQALLFAMDETKQAIADVKLDYRHLGENRYAQLFSIKTYYQEYCRERDALLLLEEDEDAYVDQVYAVYGMQDYLFNYSQRFIDLTIREGNAKYTHLMPRVYIIPIVAISISIIMGLLIFEISVVMNRSITKPVLLLANASRRIAANDFYIDDVESENEDELGELVSAFNKMKFATGEYIAALEKRREVLDELHEQTLQTLEVEKQLDQVKFQLLKSQINPHFLFNTLNVISGMANLENADNTEQMIKALSSIFRYNLKNQEKEVSLAIELKVAWDYMYLQKMRFGERLQYRVNCEVDENKVIVPTFTLQPLLENSVIHGISPKVEGGCVTTDITRVDEQLVITITDTGKGIAPDRLMEIRAALAGDKEAAVGIGMGNIYTRIKAMYKDADMKIDSVEGEGTTIQLTLPYRTEEAVSVV